MIYQKSYRMPYGGVNTSDLQLAVSRLNIKVDDKVTPSSSDLLTLKNALNKFFKDSKCLDVIYTDNTDKCFFGMCVMPKLDGKILEDLIISEDPYRITEYYLELDSRLFSSILDLSDRELTAILLHEVGHMVNTAAPMDEVRKELDTYLAKTDQNISIKDSVHYQELLIYGLKNALHKIVSMFCTRDEEVMADSFVVACGFAEELESAFNKIVKNGFALNRNVNDKFVVFSYMLRLYKDVKLRRIDAIHTMKKGKALTASKLEKREMDAVVARLNKIDDEAIIEGAYDDFVRKIDILKYRRRHDLVKQYEDDSFEYAIRVKTVNAEEDSLSLLRNINSRLSIIEEYIDKCTEAGERDRWFKLQERLIKIRDELLRKNVNRDKFIGLWVEYPEIVANRT